MDFIDEYKLLFTLEAEDNNNPAVLAMMDTSKGDQVTTTTFCLPFREAGRNVHLLLERDAQAQSYNTPTTSFRDDTEQRLIVLITDRGRPLIFPVGVLLKFHKAREGSKIAWDMWMENVATPSDLGISRSEINAWVSGCRLFAFGFDGKQRKIYVYDFSEEGQERHLGSEPDPELGVRSLGRAGEKNYPEGYSFVGGTRDSLMFITGVSITSLLQRDK